MAIDIPHLAPQAGFQCLRVLIAEDNPINQVVIARLLQALGCDAPEVVENGRQALAAFRGKDFDLIFMDCHMPDLDGYAATNRIRRMETRRNGNRRCYISALTADIMPGVEEKCHAAGMDGQLTKPYSIENLVAILELARQRAFGGGGESRAARPPGLPVSDGIDIRILDRLRLLGGKESPSIFRDLVGSFLETVPGKRAAIRDLARTLQFRPLAFAAHGLKGLCLNFGAVSMARECEALQLAAEAERPDDLPRILERISEAEDGTRRFLEGMIGAVTADAGTATEAAGKSGSHGKGGCDG